MEFVFFPCGTYLIYLLNKISCSKNYLLDLIKAEHVNSYDMVCFLLICYTVFSNKRKTQEYKKMWAMITTGRTDRNIHFIVFKPRKYDLKYTLWYSLRELYKMHLLLMLRMRLMKYSCDIKLIHAVINDSTPSKDLEFH